MAYKKKGIVTDDPVGFQDPRSIYVKAKATPTTLVLHSEAGVELEVECPAFDSKYLPKHTSADRWPTGQDLMATIYGDKDSFVRIDG